MYLHYDSDDFDDDSEDIYALAQRARYLLKDYYGTAMHSGMFAAGGDLVTVQRMSDTQVIAKARELGLL